MFPQFRRCWTSVTYTTSPSWASSWTQYSLCVAKRNRKSPGCTSTTIPWLRSKHGFWSNLLPVWLIVHCSIIVYHIRTKAKMSPRRRWKRNLPESAQQLCAHLHVFLLHDVRHGSAIPEISVVEEIHDRVANRKCIANWVSQIIYLPTDLTFFFLSRQQNDKPVFVQPNCVLKVCAWLWWYLHKCLGQSNHISSKWISHLFGVFAYGS